MKKKFRRKRKTENETAEKGKQHDVSIDIRLSERVLTLAHLPNVKSKSKRMDKTKAKQTNEKKDRKYKHTHSYTYMYDENIEQIKENP